MARAESKMIMGYLPIEERHYPALLSVLHPATPATRMLDPFAGEGAFLEAAANAWNVTPYANELDGDRAAACITRFGPTQAVRGDVERLVASNNAFGILWANPPYDHDKTTRGSKRVEFAYLRHAWKWAQDGAIVMWCVYQHHLTEEAATFLAKNSRHADVWALPGKHLGEYDQIVVVAVKGEPSSLGALYQHILLERANPRPLGVQTEPVYKAPAPRPIQRFVFTPDQISPEQGLRLIEASGGWKSSGFQALLEPPVTPAPMQPIVQPRPGHLALVLAAGVADGAVLHTDEYGVVAVRGKTVPVEQVARVEMESDARNPEQQVKKTTVRLKPTTTLTLLCADGKVVEMNGDDALLGFITHNKRALADYLNTKYQPLYRFNYAPVAPLVNRIRLGDKQPLFSAQKHVVGALTAGFAHRKGILLVGSMGVGKTVIGGAASVALLSGVVKALPVAARPGQVALIVAPPHLVEKWKRELRQTAPRAVVQRLDRHEDVKTFMDNAATLPANTPKIGLIKRDLVKLGAGHVAAVRWRTRATALWRHDAPVPKGFAGRTRVVRERIPTCPHCGRLVEVERKGVRTPATADWLAKGRRTCETCQSPLWQEARDPGSQPGTGEKFPRRNPRYRLDMYLKRRYPRRVSLLVWDEVHEAQYSDTGNGQAFNRLSGLGDRTLAMTGTPFNGRASSLFNLEYALNPRVRQWYPWGGAPRLEKKARGERWFGRILDHAPNARGRAESRWVADMGVREQVIEERPSYHRDTGAFTGTSTYERPYEEAPGISPLLVAELLDHTLFFSLGDLGKWLPQYEEIAVPVALDDDVVDQYDQTRQHLKDYLIQRRWEGDTTFRGAYLQWALGWPNAPFRPCEVIHNLRQPLTGQIAPHIVTALPSFGDGRVYAKEQALLDWLRAELAENRPCVVYVRQTGTRDIQPRLESLIRQHIAGAQPFVLRNTVSAERREQCIENAIAGGCNVLICNPELVKTGLDLLYFPTLIFYEIVFNLGTMMQAAARSYRLNQTHAHCKVLYLFAEGTMEHTAVQLMSRKQRAAKLLTGDLGLTGLDALTEGEGSFEQALLEAIGRDETLLDPSRLFRAAGADTLDAEDAAYWQGEGEADVSGIAAEGGSCRL